MMKHKYILVAISDKGAKQLDNLKQEDHVKYMSEISAVALNTALDFEGLMYIKLMPTAALEDYYSGIEIAGEGYEDFKEEAHIEKLFDTMFTNA